MFLFFLFFSGCSSYKIPTNTFEVSNIEKTSTCTLKKAALEHPLYHFIPRHRSQICWFDVGHWATWMLFGNDDDGIFGEEPSASYHLKEDISTWKAFRWSCRNPLHNFCFYVIGSASRRNSQLTLLQIDQKKICCFQYTPLAKTNFGCGTSFYLGLHGWKPFVSLQIVYSRHWRSQFYFGWRERGNFGIKFLPLVRKKRRKDYLCSGLSCPCPKIRKINEQDSCM